jgi:5'-nucleotidase
LHRPLRVDTAVLADGTPALTTDGSPVDCVALALLGVVERPVDIVVSGINTTHNLGLDVFYSGTVGAAMEASIGRIPAIAISTLYDAEIGCGPAAEIGLQVARQVIDRGLPRYTVLNVNVPCTTLANMKGFKITAMGMSAYHQDELVKAQDPFGDTYYTIRGQPLSGISDNGSDINAVADNWVSVTPLRLDLTTESFTEKLLSWDLEVPTESG